MTRHDRKARLAVDIGGTFTDIVLDRGDGRHVSGKYLTTHAAPEIAVLEGTADLLRKTGLAPETVGLVVHGTTLATNALIERKGARVAFVTTAGFRDSLEIAHEHRFEVSDLYMTRPEPLVPRDLRLEVDERLAADGSVLRPLDPASVEALVPALRDEGIEAVAVCLMHSYVDGSHERRVAEILRAALPGLRITLSHEICPEIREYERGSTAVANAYVQPVMESYLRRLADGIARLGIPGEMMLMTSSGGLASLELACAQPIKLVESGPAGGAVLAAHVARQGGLDRVIAFDMGGTTAKLVLINDGKPQVSRHLEVARAYRFLKGSGLPLRVPVIDLVEIGAGGGSIARLDQMGRVAVGPQSAGSEPGPASYGRGGEWATVTDADLLLGKLDADNFAGGSLSLDPGRASAALLRHLGAATGGSDKTAAIAVVEVVDENMANAARVHATDNGEELEGRTMIAFGGAAPLHAARIAQKLGIDRVIVPRGAGVGSAHGFLLAPVSYEAVRTHVLRESDFDPLAVAGLFEGMRRECEANIAAGLAEGAPRDERRSVYMRYRGQGHEVRVELGTGDLAEETAPAKLRALFEAEYARHFGRTIPGMDLECLTWTLALSARSTEPPSGPVPVDGEQARPRPVRTQELVDLASMTAGEAGIYRRGDLTPGASLRGPAIISEAETNTVVPAGFTAVIDAFGQIVLENGGERP